jgi:hypothetical protein
MIYDHPLWIVPAMLAFAVLVCAVLLRGNR